MIAEIVGPSGRVHYRRPPNDPLVHEALNTPGYSVRLVESETHERAWDGSGAAIMYATKTMTDAEIVEAVRKRTHVLVATGGDWQCGELDDLTLEKFLDTRGLIIRLTDQQCRDVAVALLSEPDNR